MKRNLQSVDVDKQMTSFPTQQAVGEKIMNYKRNVESDYQVQLNLIYCTYSGDELCKSVKGGDGRLLFQIEVGKWGIEVAFLRTLREQRNPIINVLVNLGLLSFKQRLLVYVAGYKVVYVSGKEELTLIEFILEMEICHCSAFPKIKKLSSVVIDCPGKYILEQFGNNMCKLSTLYKLEICVLQLDWIIFTELNDDNRLSETMRLPTARQVVFKVVGPQLSLPVGINFAIGEHHRLDFYHRIGYVGVGVFELKSTVALGAVPFFLAMVMENKLRAKQLCDLRF
ncbi:hypothetical protein T4B_13606 [Trichinella pseudospiralis]|uniref:Uncharacterized protein n=1 Tax=Trichinella pseudospiralis TaxID=6337 RepID=A0A0V1IZ74_TRIPS|nr:hypothetical protein T4B_13606 [Trichinella pseudospiralis]